MQVKVYVCVFFISRYQSRRSSYFQPVFNIFSFHSMTFYVANENVITQTQTNIGRLAFCVMPTA